MKMEGNKITLRHVEKSDAKLLFEIEQDKDNRKNMISYDKTISETERSIKENILEYKKKKPEKELFIIEFKDSPTGYISIHDLNKPKKEHSAVISYAIHPKYRGRGITTGAIKIIADYSFKKYKLKRLCARCRTFNKASARVLEKAGFKLEGIHKKELKKGNKYLDNMYYAIVK